MLFFFFHLVYRAKVTAITVMTRMKSLSTEKKIKARKE